MERGNITYTIIPAGHDLETIVVNAGGRSVPLHSRVNPERDADLLKDRFDPSRYDFLIILGVGLGYHCLPLRDMINRYSRVILIDILEGIHNAIEKNRLTSFLTADPRITLVTGKTTGEIEEMLTGLIDMDTVRGISVVEHPASVRLFGDYYGAVKKSIDKIINIKAGNRATLKAFGTRYLRNIMLNLPLMGRVRPVRHLYNAFAGYPVIITGSGPSLDHDAPAIARLQERFFIIAVDSALPALLGRGIEPDIVISIDPQPYVYEHVQGCRCGHALPVHSLSSHPLVMKKMPGYLSLNSHPFSQLAAEVYGDGIGSIDSATGSVAGDAVSLAARCGFSHIGMTGLDFCFPGFAIYARGTAYQKRYGVFFNDRFATVEGLNMSYILRSSGGVRHGKAFTRKSFLQYRQALEDYIRNNAPGQVSFLNEQGLDLAGTDRVTVEDFSHLRCSAVIDKRNIIASLHRSSQPVDARPLAAAMKRIVNEKLFGDLLEASLGNAVNGRKRERYRALALNAIRSMEGLES